ncbi:MAG TPA: NIL domain-containing protein [Allocoleopsis sp.]
MFIAISRRYQHSSAQKRFVANALSDTPTTIRLQLGIPKLSQKEPIISQLIASYAITVKLVRESLQPKTDVTRWFDVELTATPEQLQEGLAFLQSLRIKIIGKANPGYDGWHL